MKPAPKPVNRLLRKLHGQVRIGLTWVRGDKPEQTLHPEGNPAEPEQDLHPIAKVGHAVLHSLPRRIFPTIARSYSALRGKPHQS